VRAVLVSEFGGPEQLRPDRVADPVAGPGQVRVAVRAAGLNPVDAGNRTDGRWAGLRVPCILGYDIAGVIDGVGPGVTGLAPGDRVMAMTHFPDGAGGYAELAVIDAVLAAPISGQIAAIATPELDLDLLLDANITFHGVLIQDDGDRTRALAGLLGRRELRPVISHVLPLEAAAEAHRILENGHAGGKIVLDVTSS
jgi:NADPH:quinone reductase-like Zn-dependent oxidoreductase